MMRNSVCVGRWVRRRNEAFQREGRKIDPLDIYHLKYQNIEIV